jgi:tRNA nucleotidyltransferase (CCA-adding enzyme)
VRHPCEAAVLEWIKPTAGEREQILGVAKELVEAIERSGSARAMIVGSVARGTWVRGDRDLDVFMLFPPDLPREELEVQGLSLARSIARRYGDEYHEKYAEHPYINTNVDGIDVDLVPCYAVESAARIQSAVDRTPFHTRYLLGRIGGLVDDVLLTKQFAMVGGVYGSDQMTEGFSGYLCELLVLHYGGFTPLMQAASGWRRHTVIDIEGHAGKEFDDPLVVIDPVDPCRNVAAAVSLTRMFEFVELARGYMKSPSCSFFVPIPAVSITRDEYIQALTLRETSHLAIFFQTPPCIPDVVVPQLRKSLEAISGLLERSGFLVNRSDYCMQENCCMLLLELFVDRLPVVRRHIGPPLWSTENAEKFASKYRNETFSGPFIEEGIYIVEIPRRFTRARELLLSGEMLETGLGKHVKQSMEKGWTVCEGADCWREEFAPFINQFLHKVSPLMRIRDRERRETEAPHENQ